MKGFFHYVVRFLMRAYPLILVAGIALAILSWPRMVYLLKNISTDPVDLLPRNFPSVETILKIRDHLDTPPRFGLVFESDKPEQVKQLLKDLAPELKKIPSVGKVMITKPGYDFLDKNKFLFMETKDLLEVRDRIDRKIQQEKLGPMYISFEDEDTELNFEDLEEKYRSRYSEGSEERYYVSPNGKIYAAYLVAAETEVDIESEMAFQEDVKKVVREFNYKKYDPDLKIYYGGSSRVKEYRALIRDLKISGTISAILIFLPLLFRFRRPQYIFLIFFPLLIGIPSGIALASVWIPRLNVTTSFLFAILGGLGVESGIHLFSRYYEKRKGGLGVEEALLDLYQKMGKPVFTAVAALATTFLLMVFSDFRGFSEFGIMSGVGLWVVFILYFTFFPALLILAEKLNLIKFKIKFTEIKGAFNMSPGFTRICLAIFAIFTVFSLLVLPRFQFEYDSKKVRADSPADRLATLKQRLTAGKRVNRPAVVLVDDEAQADFVQNEIQKRRDENPKSLIDHTASLYSFVPKDQEKKLATLNEIHEMLSDDTLRLVPEDKKSDLDKFKKEIKRPEKFRLSDVPSEIKEIFKTKGDKKIVFIFARPQLELDDARNAIRFGNEIREIPSPQGTLYASSSAMVFADVVITMLKDSKKILLLAILSVSLFVFLDFRSLKKTGLVMFSILTGVVWCMGVLFLLGDKINLYNLAMIPAVMGMSVDNSIHLYHRYQELGPGSLAKVLATTGIAAGMASLTNAAGFVGLSFATHGGLHSMGILAVIGVITTLLSTLLMMPLILHWYEGRKKLTQIPQSYSDKPGSDAPYAS